MFFNLADYDRAGVKGPVPRISGIKDGAGTTLMMTENNTKTYFDSSNNPLFSWAAGSESVSGFGSHPSEQQLGIVWVVR